MIVRAKGGGYSPPKRTDRLSWVPKMPNLPLQFWQKTGVCTFKAKQRGQCSTFKAKKGSMLYLSGPKFAEKFTFRPKSEPVDKFWWKLWVNGHFFAQNPKNIGSILYLFRVRGSIWGSLPVQLYYGSTPLGSWLKNEPRQDGHLWKAYLSGCVHPIVTSSNTLTMSDCR